MFPRAAIAISSVPRCPKKIWSVNTMACWGAEQQTGLSNVRRTSTTGQKKKKRGGCAQYPSYSDGMVIVELLSLP